MFAPPLSRQPDCPVCPHEHHALPCEWCACVNPPIVGGVTEESDDHY